MSRPSGWGWRINPESHVTNGAPPSTGAAFVAVSRYTRCAVRDRLLFRRPWSARGVGRQGVANQARSWCPAVFMVPGRTRTRMGRRSPTHSAQARHHRKRRRPNPACACQDGRVAYRNWFDSMPGKCKGRKVVRTRSRNGPQASEDVKRLAPLLLLHRSSPCESV